MAREDQVSNNNRFQSAQEFAEAEDLTTNILSLEREITELNKRCQEADQLISIIHEQCVRSRETIDRLKVELL